MLPMLSLSACVAKPCMSWKKLRLLSTGSSHHEKHAAGSSSSGFPKAAYTSLRILAMRSEEARSGDQDSLSGSSK